MKPRDELFGQSPPHAKQNHRDVKFGDGLTMGKGLKMTDDRRNKRANAEPAGGGGGAWADFNKKRSDSRATKTQAWAAEKIAEGDIQGGMAANLSGTSIFDPVLAELCYRWYCPPGGVALDPFAGGSVRGIVAAKLGRRYVGIDLSERQLAANRTQAEAILEPTDPVPVWIAGDSLNIERLAPPALDIGGADFLFSCPPYGDLEVYSDDPRDLSVKSWSEFLDCYREIISASAGLLKPHRFACFVVGDFRDKEGHYRGFPWRTVEAFEAAGLKLYNEAVLVTAAGSLPLRTRKQFESSRKLGKTHQNVLIFLKGDPRLAAKQIGPVQFYKGEGETELGPERELEEPRGMGPAPIMAPVAPARWKVSAAWLKRNHDCTLAGILGRCHGGCCKGDSFWPSKAFAEPGKPTVCGNLGPQGCVLPQSEKPAKCLLYPLMLNPNGTLILHHRTTTAGSVCKGNHGLGPPLVEALAANLTELFGPEQYERVRVDVLAGRDSYFEPSRELLAALDDEARREAANQPPGRRGQAQPPKAPANITEIITGPLTPIQAVGDIWLKRDDLFEIAGMRGGKVRTCWHLAQGEKNGLVTAGARASPQINIVAHIAQALGLKCRAHTPNGKLGAEVAAAEAAGAVIIQHNAGYNSVLVARARDDAKAQGWTEIPFGMECHAAVEMTAGQYAEIPEGVKRVVVSVGSGMSLAGILQGMRRAERMVPILGVVVGADPKKRLARFAPVGWERWVELRPAGSDYHEAVEAEAGGVQLDPHYEAKCARFLEPGDLFWLVGIRQQL